jgi:hypothetical protein
MKNPLLPEPRPLAIWIKDLSRIICRWKVSIFRESILPIQLLIVIVLSALEPSSISSALKVLPCKVVIVLSVDVVVVILRLAFLPEKAVQS